MDYRIGTMGRVLNIRFDHGENLLKGLEKIIVKEDIQSAWFQILGGLAKSGVVTGPKAATVPPDPVWRTVDDVREVIGSGSVHWDGDTPKIHLHAAMGHHGDTLTACIRKYTEIYLVLEVILFELKGISATRPWYDQGGFYRLKFD